MIYRALKDVALLAYWHPARRLVQVIGHRPAYHLAHGLAKLQRTWARGKIKALAFEYDWLNSTRSSSLAATRESAIRNALALHWCNEMDVLLYPVLSSKKILAITSVTGIEHLDNAIANDSGAMLAFGHYGANQMIMAAIGGRGYPMSQISAPPTVWPEKIPGRNFSRVEKHCLALRWEQEKSLPVEHVSVFGSLKPALRRLKSNGVLGIAVDGGGGSTRVDVPFFGRHLRLSTGAAEIALRTGCRMLPAFMSRNPDGTCLLEIEQPIPATGEERSEAVYKLTAAFASRLEHHVRNRPGHYLEFLALRRFMTTQGDPPLLVDDGS